MPTKSSVSASKLRQSPDCAPFDRCAHCAAFALQHTQFVQATCGTIRLKLLKIGALVRISVRRIKIAMASACPHQNEFALAHSRLAAAAG
jgi:DDE family transposase